MSSPTIPTSTGPSTSSTNTDTLSEKDLFLQECLSYLGRQELPVLAELHDGYAPLKAGMKPKRSANRYMLFRSWVGKAIGPKGTTVSDKLWRMLDPSIPEHADIVARMVILAEDLASLHNSVYPGYKYQPQKKGDKNSGSDAPSKEARKRSKAAKSRGVGMSAASGSGQSVAQEPATWFAPASSTTQGGPFGPYHIPDGGHPQGHLQPFHHYHHSQLLDFEAATPALTSTSSASPDGFYSPLNTPPLNTWEVKVEEALIALPLPACPEWAAMMEEINKGIEMPSGKFWTWPQFHAWKDQQPVDPLEFVIDMEKFGY